MRRGRVISVFQREPSITSCVCLSSADKSVGLVGVGSVGWGLPVPGSALVCISLPRAPCVQVRFWPAQLAVPALQAALQGCSMSINCPVTGAGGSGQADWSIAADLVMTLLPHLLCRCPSWDCDAWGPFCTDTPHLQRDSAASGTLITCHC